MDDDKLDSHIQKLKDNLFVQDPHLAQLVSVDTSGLTTDEDTDRQLMSATTHLSVRPSVCLSVRPSVSLCLSVTPSHCCILSTLMVFNDVNRVICVVLFTNHPGALTEPVRVCSTE